MKYYIITVLLTGLLLSRSTLGEAGIFLSSRGYIQNYYQLSIDDLRDEGKLHCINNEGHNDSSLLWILPSGDIIHSLSAGTSLLNNSHHSLMLPLHLIKESGVYTCKVKDSIVDGTIDQWYVWITLESESPAPFIKEYSCMLESIFMYQELYVIIMRSLIERGAPSDINCFITGSPQQMLRQAAKDRNIVSSYRPVPQARVSVGYLVPFLKPPFDIQCIISNLGGQDSFNCILQDSNISKPIVHTIVKKPDNEVLLRWNGVKDPMNLLSHYSVYQQTSEGLIIKKYVPGPQAIIPDTRALGDVRIVANSQQPLHNVIHLPSIGSINNKCQPSFGYTIQLAVTRAGDANLSTMINDAIGSTGVTNACSTVDANILSTKVIKESTRTRSKANRTKTKRKTNEKHKKSKAKTKTKSKTKAKTKKSKTKAKTKKSKTKAKTKKSKTKAKTKKSKTKTKTKTKTRAKSRAKTRKTYSTVAARVLVTCDSCSIWRTGMISNHTVETFSQIISNFLILSGPQYYCQETMVDSRNRVCDCSTRCKI